MLPAKKPKVDNLEVDMFSCLVCTQALRKCKNENCIQRQNGNNHCLCVRQRKYKLRYRDKCETKTRNTQIRLIVQTSKVFSEAGHVQCLR